MRKGFIKILALSALFLAVSAFKAQGNIKIAVTTSIENTGLLDVLLPVFKERYGIEIHVIAAGSGRSLKLAENGDVDLVLVHYPKIEKEFIKQGFGIDRKSVFYNYFVVVGPKADPAGIKNSRTANDAFRKLVAGGVIFISRGDNSGTHGKEMEIWDTINFSPRGQWYIETGQGMGPTLMIASEKQGYCLVDMGTFMAYEDKINLGLLFKGDKFLINPYSIIAVNPDRYPHIKYKQARLFVDWISSREAHDLIASFRKQGRPLFYPTDN